MKYFRELVLEYVGRPAFVFGGGKAGYEMLESLGKKYPEAIRISANLHGLRKSRCDYIFCVDDEVFLDVQQNRIETPTLSCHPRATYRIVEVPKLTHSGNYAVWCAWNMGCSPIFVFGMDCYTEGTYFHDADAFSLGNRIPLEVHLKTWETVRRRVSDKAIIRMMGGPVPPIFPAYDPTEVYPRVEFPDRLTAVRSHLGKRVKITHPTRVDGEPLEPGQYIELSRSNANRLIERRRAVSAPVSL